ncbi:YkvA family protein [Pseudoblastomonas halimionae]|uniref:DUF1232 domain-containing protein n=1 Tax=Alteriqipengyuania halimionae TaxID=1926630 RepID=A0A6I4U927_9SPHN|nr:DUF1232 domain-containing protein [Alteriqipengyuania halimionae]MXP10831.1 DUF1232 domain-containing protein [Alteriqipengyuania halimionae]
MLARLRVWAKRLRREALMLWLAARDPRTPTLAKAIAAAAAAYAFSPIDLIPDFLPVIGLQDELVILPLAIALALKRLPRALAAELRERASTMAERPVSRTTANAVVTVWIALFAIAWIRFSG